MIGMSYDETVVAVQGGNPYRSDQLQQLALGGDRFRYYVCSLVVSRPEFLPKSCEWLRSSGSWAPEIHEPCAWGGFIRRWPAPCSELPSLEES